MSLINQAKVELDLINFGEEDTRVMIEILEKFFDQWDSGGAVATVQPILNRCIAGKPLSPLMGTDDEFVEVGTGVFQNKRCSTVFKEDGRAYDIDTPGRPTITFPYNPRKSTVDFPIYEIKTKE